MRHSTISRSILMLACGVAGLVTFEFAQGRDWPSWRGPNRDGISSEKGLLKEWPEDGPTLAWQSTGLGNAYSGVAVAGGKIYTMGQRRDTDLICLDGKNGKELWATKVGGGEPNCTPTVDGDLVYALGRDGDLLCARTKDGSEVWRTSFSKDFGGKMMSGWGYSESPLVDGDRLIVTPGSKDAMIVALDKKTGKVIWKSAVPDLGKKGGDGAAYSSIVISNAAGVKQYVQLTGRGVISVDAKDGTFLWSYNAIANGTANIPTPIVKGDYVFCSTGYNTGAALLEVVRKGSDLVTEEIYFLQPKELQNHHGGMVLVGDHIYCGNKHNEGFPICIELKTGKTVWSPGRGPGSGSAAVIYADGELYFRYENGIMALIEATPDEYRLKGSFKLATVNGKSWPHPSIVDGQLYVRDGKDLLVYDIKAK
jgi:outer membrane protein assembly factor BamB